MAPQYPRPRESAPTAGPLEFVLVPMGSVLHQHSSWKMRREGGVLRRSSRLDRQRARGGVPGSVLFWSGIPLNSSSHVTCGAGRSRKIHAKLKQIHLYLVDRYRRVRPFKTHVRPSSIQTCCSRKTEFPRPHPLRPELAPKSWGTTFPWWVTWF